jgi:hypothetical protein
MSKRFNREKLQTCYHILGWWKRTLDSPNETKVLEQEIRRLYRSKLMRLIHE